MSNILVGGKITPVVKLSRGENHCELVTVGTLIFRVVTPLRTSLKQHGFVLLILNFVGNGVTRRCS